MINTTSLFYILALVRTEGIGDTFAKKLLSIFGSAENVFSANKQDFRAISRLSENSIHNILNKSSFEKTERETVFIQKQKIKTYYIEDNDYPEKLRHCSDAPVLLFSKGNTNLNGRKVLSIVGTRQITNYGISFCNELIEELTPINPIIVSGFALGTDICAHLSAMENKLQTIGVLAHGFDRIYPNSHKKYTKKMQEKGGFLTEFWSESVPERENFIRRNRIVAGATIVIESPKKGGSLITANLANDYSREVFAVPGKTTDFYSQGCNNLIKTQKANLLTSANDILYMMNWDLQTEKPKNVQKKLFIDLNTEEQKIYDYLYQNGKEILDLIAKKCKKKVVFLPNSGVNLYLNEKILFAEIVS